MCQAWRAFTGLNSHITIEASMHVRGGKRTKGAFTDSLSDAVTNTDDVLS